MTIITMADFKPVDNLMVPYRVISLRQVRELFLGEPGTVEHLVVKAKDGATHDVDLTLEDYV